MDMNNSWSSIQSPQSEASPSAALLAHRSPTAIRISHLSGDLFLPKHSHTPEPGTKPQETWDPFHTGQGRSSITTLDFKKQVLNGYFGVTPGEHVASRQGQSESRCETKVFSASDYPELKETQLEACLKLSGGGNIDPGDCHELDRSGTIQSILTRHNYGRVNTNEDICSVYGFHEVTHEEGEGLKDSKHAPGDQIEQVEWTPRSSIEMNATKIVPQHHPGAPPSESLPQTPQGKGTARYRLEDPSSPSEGISRSSESYGNTNKLLQLSLPQLPAAPVPNNLYRQLVQFARGGHSSSSHGSSSKSFAEFSIEQPHGGQITRPVSQGEFQVLERAISSHLRRESRMSDDTAAASLVHLGQISLRFPDPSSEADLGPGSSQTASSTSEVQVNWETGSVQVPQRTRNGTPPLLFGGLNRPRNDADWETVGDSHEMTSIADISDSTSGRPSRSFPSIPPGKVLRHPAHPRYNHSWDLQQDVRSGAFVLIPRYEQLCGGSSFPNQNALEPLALRGAQNNYSHPTPLTASHKHPFAAPPVSIVPAERGCITEFNQQMGTVYSQNQLHSQSSSAWLSTAATNASPLPPLPKKNPSRLMKQQPRFNFGLQSSDSSKIDQVSAMEEGSVNHDPAIPSAIVPTPLTLTTVLEGRGSSIPLRSPHRHLEGKANQNQLDEEDPGRNPFDDAAMHEKPVLHSPASMLAFPENSYSPAHRGRAGAGAARARDFVTAEQVKYLRSRPPSWMPTNVEMQAIISPAAACVCVPRAPPAALMVPRVWVPTPHPLAQQGTSREESPHLWHLPRPQGSTSSSSSPRQQSQQQLVSRYCLVACALLPVLLPLYFLGSLDWIVQVHTGGLYREMGGQEKKMALLILCVELLGIIAFVPLVLSIL
ncbi:MAG: hypothetical protein Q9182_004988 [Xanthomendoza sp. 2 TL-2023]